MSKYFFNKLKSYFTYFFICIPLLILLLLLSPFKLIRVYKFNYRIGHFSEDFFLYLCKKKSESKQYLDLFYIDEEDGKINPSLVLLAKTNGIIFFPKFIISYLYFFIKILSKKIKYLKIFLAYERNTKKDGYQFFKSDLKILIPEFIKEKGEEFFKKINPNNKKIICLNLWNNAHLPSLEGLDWSHHNFRNSSFENYIKVIKYLTEQGYLVIKVGRSNEESIVKNNPNFIDYSYNYANDYLDIALVNKCYAYLSNATGLDHLYFSFNKPMLIVSSHIHDFFIERKNVIYLMRPYYSNTKNKFLSLKEMICDLNLGFVLKNQEFKEKKIEIRNNSNEILFATKDLLYLIKNQFNIDKDLKIYSNKFFKYFMIAKEKNKTDLNYYKNIEIKSFYSWSVIKQNINWLE